MIVRGLPSGDFAVAGLLAARKRRMQQAPGGVPADRSRGHAGGSRGADTCGARWSRPDALSQTGDAGVLRGGGPGRRSIINREE